MKIRDAKYRDQMALTHSITRFKCKKEKHNLRFDLKKDQCISLYESDKTWKDRRSKKNIEARSYVKPKYFKIEKQFAILRETEPNDLQSRNGWKANFLKRIWDEKELIKQNQHLIAWVPQRWIRVVGSWELAWGNHLGKPLHYFKKLSKTRWNKIKWAFPYTEALNDLLRLRPRTNA